MKLGEIIEVEIEKTVYGGDGLARYGKEQFVVFVKNSIPKDKNGTIFKSKRAENIVCFARIDCFRF